MKTHDETAARRCQASTRGGAPCACRAVDGPFCRSHAATPFYARALSDDEQHDYAEALAQEGLAGEIAALRLHLLRLLARDDGEGIGEIPRTVHALIRALRDKERAATDPVAALDAAVRAEGLRLLDGTGDDAAAAPRPK